LKHALPVRQISSSANSSPLFSSPAFSAPPPSYRVENARPV